jgi:hypothetical protein
MHVLIENLSWKVHLMLQKQHWQEEMRCRQSKTVRAPQMVVKPGLGASRFDFPKPAFTHPNLGRQLLLRHALVPPPFLDTATRDLFDLG